MDERWIDRTNTRFYLLGALIILLAVSGGILLPGKAAAQNLPQQPFKLLFPETEEEAGPHKYRVYVEGLGMLGKTQGTLTGVTIPPGTSIVKAYLVWSGLGTDNEVSFARDGGPSVLVKATSARTWDNNTNNPTGQDTWSCCGNQLSVYVADVTNSVLVGAPHNYTVSGMAITHTANNRPVVENWGFSLIVIYEDPNLAKEREVFIKLGNDGFFYDWGYGRAGTPEQLGPYSDVQCVEIGRADGERTALYLAIVGGIEDEFRPNGLWGLAGSGPSVSSNDGGTWTRQVGLITVPSGPAPSDTYIPSARLNAGTVGAIEIDGPLDGDNTGSGIVWPFHDLQGEAWNSGTAFTFPEPLSPEDEWVCLQVESAARNALLPIGIPGDRNFHKPASIGFIGFVTVIEPTIISMEVEVEPTYEWTYTVTNPDKTVTGQPSLQDVRLVAGPHVTVACPKTTLAVGESMQCTATSTDLAYYGSVAWVIGVPTGGGIAVLASVQPNPRAP